MKNITKLTALVTSVLLMLSLCSCGNTPTPSTPPDSNNVQIPEGSTFSIEFFDVGNADAALIECDGKYMLIDGGNKADSQKMYTILKEKEIAHLEYVIASNIAAEHIGGISGALNYAIAGTTFCPTVSENTDVFNDFKKYADKNGGGITIPKAGNKYKLGNAEIEFLAVTTTPEVDSSLIVKITYGNTSFIFAGNHHIMTEQAAVNGNADLKSTVLKVAANGGDDTTSTEFLRKVAPEYAVISTSGTEGYPGKTTVSILEMSDVKLYRTDLHGDIYCTSDGNTVTFKTEKTADSSKLYVEGSDAQPKETEKPSPEPSPAVKPTVVPSPTPAEKPVSPASADELYEANLMTNLVRAYGSVKTVSHYMGATHIIGSYMVGDKMAYINTHMYPGDIYSYNGWYNGYGFNDYGERPSITAYVEKLEGDPISPNQTDLAYYFLHEEDIEYLGKDGEDFIFRINSGESHTTLTVDSMSFAVKKAEYFDGEYVTDVQEYIFGEWIEGQDILNAWQDGSGLKVVSVYADIYEGSEHQSYHMPIYLPLNWELDVISANHNVGIYMDSNYTQPYKYPGDGVSYDLYVTNAVG